MLLRTFGALTLEAEPGDRAPLPQLAGRRLALLALTAAAGARGVSRDSLLGILWADTDEELARHTLSQHRYTLRRVLGIDAITGTSHLRLHSSITSDVAAFQHAIECDDMERAAELYCGSFLDGFYLARAPEFEQWVEETRGRLRRAAMRAMESVARRAFDQGELSDALEQWRRLADLEPYNASFASECVRTLAARGNHVEALRVAHEYEALVRRKLDSDPDPTVRAIAATPTSALVVAAIPRAGASSAPNENFKADANPNSSLPSPNDTGATRESSARRDPRALLVAAIAIVTMGLGWKIGVARASARRAIPILAVGAIQSRDTAAAARVLRDMLATNLARIPGVRV
ncbi:MAG: BTAD domain-containing putative transcriptional regulator, partial [Gemmatimonadaceae bacterium]